MEGIPEDFEIKDENGNLITKAMQRKFILRDWAIIDTTLSNTYVIDSLEVRGDSAVVITSQAWKRIMFRKDGISTDTVLTTQVHREIWRRTNRKWRNYQIEELGGKIFLNGKEYKE
jgi:osmotically-inducible protein OsmY